MVAAVAIAIGLRRWRSRGDGGSAEPPEQAVTAAESKRIGEDLARYRL